jgi:phosphoribosylaminoimidazolecarboxamide formyltransferase/IMP cyclohydrolase
MADRVAAFGGAVAVNRPLDLETAKLIVETYCEVGVAPEFRRGVMDILNSKKNLRVFSHPKHGLASGFLRQLSQS